jgi:hypothetical protein
MKKTFLLLFFPLFLTAQDTLPELPLPPAAIVVQEWIPTKDPSKEILVFCVKYGERTVARFVAAEGDYVEINGEPVMASLVRASAFADNYKPLPGEFTDQGPKLVVREVTPPETIPTEPTRGPKFDENGKVIIPAKRDTIE